MLEQITPAQFSEWSTQHGTADKKALIIDVREPNEWAIVSLPPAAADAPYDVLHLSMGSIPGELNQLDPDRPTAFLCHHGQRSNMVGLFLQQNGFTQLANIQGGIDAWALIEPSLPRY